MKLEDCKEGLLARVLGKSIYGDKDYNANLYPAHKRGWGYITKTSDWANVETVYLTSVVGGESEPGAYSPNDLEPYEPEETEYRQLKDITPRAIFEAQGIFMGNDFMREFIRFVQFFHLNYENVADFEDLTWELENEPKWEKWLIEYGFIEKVVEPEAITYTQGDELVNDKGEKGILAQVDTDEVSIIITEGWDKGNRYHHPVLVKNIHKITAEEFKQTNAAYGTWRKDK